MNAASELYLDTSAVVKLYVEEKYSRHVRQLLKSGACVISRLTQVEVQSAFHRAVRSGVLAAEDGDRAVAGFHVDLKRWDVMELTGDVTAEAIDLVWRHSLRAADAIQLGSALVFQRRLGQPLHGFVTFDRRLVDAARAERLPVFDPGDLS